MDGKDRLIYKIQRVGKRYLEVINPTDPLDRDIAKNLSKFSLDTTLYDELQELQILIDLRSLISVDGIDGELVHNIGVVINNYPAFEHVTWDNSNPPSIHKILDLMIADAKKNINPQLFEDTLKSPRVKSFETFGNNKNLNQEDASGLFSHVTEVVRKRSDSTDSPKSMNEWFAKQCASKVIALREVIAQEFFRLIMPYQPKTRIAKANTGKTFVVSKGRKGTTSLGKIPFEENIKAFGENYGQTNGYKGLGGVLVIMLLLNETDAKLGNLLVDTQGRIIKIDGDYCFSKLNDSRHSQSNSDISSNDFSSLPFVSDYASFNWLDLIRGGELNSRYMAEKSNDLLFDQSLINNPIFRQEVNEATLKVLALPSELLKQFVSSYTHSHSETDLLTNELLQRTTQLRQAALENPNFLDYVKSNTSKENLNQFVDELKEFKTMKKHHLLNETNQSLISKIKNKFTHISTSIKNVYSTTDSKIKEFLTQKSTYAASLPRIKPAPPLPKVEEKIENNSKLAKNEKIKKPTAKKNAVLPAVNKQPERDMSSIIREALIKSDGFSSSNDRFFNPQKAPAELPPLVVAKKLKGY
jgi:hypothetical protein